MKRTLPLLVMAIFSLSLIQAQGIRTPRAVNPLAHIEHMDQMANDALPLCVKPFNASVSAKSVSEDAIGETRYDLQTNSTSMNRAWLFPDGTIGAVWTQGLIDGSFSDRGTGYNYFDGSSWGPFPTTRVESVRTGWPTYAPYGANGEIIGCHDFASTGGVVISKRTTKGSGAWTQSLLQGPAGHPDLAWPRLTTSGSDHSVIQVLGITKSTANGGTPYQGLEGALLYSRSTDGGQTWNPQNAILPGMSSAEYKGIPADAYAWAVPKGDTLAFVVGDNWIDAFLMKSTDGGTTWTKTLIFEHPYPLFDEATMLVLDTPYVCDGSMAVALDPAGNAHVAFGLMRVLNDDLTDGNTSYFPFTDGIAYWKEGDGVFPTLNIDTLYDNGDLVAWMQDINQNDTIDYLGGMESIGTYYSSLNSMPSLSIDEENNVMLVWSGLTEGKDNGVQMFRHIWARSKFHWMPDWSDFHHLTSSIIHNFDECTYPILSGSSNNYWHLIYQADEEPGLHIQGDEDAPTDNTITYMKVSKQGVGIAEIPPLAEVSAVYPNPATDMARVDLQLLRPAMLSCSLMNLAGQTLRSCAPQMLGSGNQAVIVGLEGLAPGAYLLNLNDGQHSVTRKLLVR